MIKRIPDCVAVVALGLTSCILALVYAAICQRPFAFEGSEWIYIGLNENSPYNLAGLGRQSDALLQWPAILLSRMGASIQVTLAAMNFAYVLHPFISLVACGFIVGKRQIYLLVFPVLALVASVMPTIAFAMGVVNTANSFLWPLLFIILTDKFEKPFWMIIGDLLLLALFFTHQSAIIFPFVIFLAVFAKNQWRRPETFSDSFVLIASVAMFLTYAQRLLFLRENQPAFVNTFITFTGMEHVDSARAFGFGVAAITLLLLTASARGNKLKAIVPIRLFLLLSAAVFFNLGFGLEDLDRAYVARTTATSVSALIALAAVFLYQSLERRSFWENGQDFFPMGAVLACALCFCAVRDASLTATWNNSIASGLETIQEPGCHLVDNRSAGAMNLYTSILVQGTFRPTALLISEEACQNHIFAEFCAGFRDKKSVSGCVPRGHFIRGRFKYGRLEIQP